MAATITLDDSEMESGDHTIADLSEDERLMLIGFAQTLYDRTTRSMVARLALDRVSAQLIHIAPRTA